MLFSRCLPSQQLLVWPCDACLPWDEVAQPRKERVASGIRLRLHAISCYPFGSWPRKLFNSWTMPWSTTHLAYTALSPHALPSSHVFAIQFPCFLLNASDTRQHVGSQVPAAAPPRLTRRRTSATPSFPGRTGGDNQAHCGSRVLPWPWMREICRRT